MPRQKKDFLLNPVVITVVVVITIIAAFNFYQTIEKMNHLEKEIKETEKQITEAEAENQKLKEQIENSNNYEYIEEVAREKLGLVKPGEKLLIPVEAKTKDEEKKESDSNN